MNERASAWDMFEALPSNWTKMSVESIVRNWLIGKFAKVNHPITDGNGFVITEVRIENDFYDELPYGRIFVRGENTMWFGQNSFKIDVM